MPSGVYERTEVNKRVAYFGRRSKHTIAVKRVCLKCNLLFSSTGIGNRICNLCKVKNAGMNIGETASPTKTTCR